MNAEQKVELETLRFIKKNLALIKAEEGKANVKKLVDGVAPLGVGGAAGVVGGGMFSLGKKVFPATTRSIGRAFSNKAGGLVGRGGGTDVTPRAQLVGQAIKGDLRRFSYANLSKVFKRSSSIKDPVKRTTELQKVARSISERRKITATAYKKQHYPGVTRRKKAAFKLADQAGIKFNVAEVLKKLPDERVAQLITDPRFSTWFRNGNTRLTLKQVDQLGSANKVSKADVRPMLNELVQAVGKSGPPRVKAATGFYGNAVKKAERVDGVVNSGDYDRMLQSLGKQFSKAETAKLVAKGVLKTPGAIVGKSAGVLKSAITSKVAKRGAMIGAGSLAIERAARGPSPDDGLIDAAGDAMNMVGDGVSAAAGLAQRQFGDGTENVAPPEEDFTHDDDYGGEPPRPLTDEQREFFGDIPEQGAPLSPEQEDFYNLK